MKLLTSPFGSVGHALALTVKAARVSGDKYIDIPCGEYHVYKEDSEHTVLCVSNHGHNGYKSAALVIEDFDGLTVDGNGSVFNLHGCMDFAIVNNSKNITIKNLTVKCIDICNFQGKVVESSPEMVKVYRGDGNWTPGINIEKGEIENEEISNSNSISSILADPHNLMHRAEYN